VIDLWLVDKSLLVLRPASQVFGQGRLALSYLSAQSGFFRVYSPSYSIGQHVGARYGIEQLDGVDPTQLQWVAAFMAKAGGYEIGGYGVTIPFYPDDVDVHEVWSGAVPDASLLGLLNAKFVVAEYPIDAPGLRFAAQAGSSYLYQNDRALPRAFTVARVEPVSGWQGAQVRLQGGFDPALGALVEDGIPLTGAGGLQPAEIVSFTPNKVVVKAKVEQESLLVLSEVWFPGWQVTVDGVRARYYRVDGIVRGVYLAPGSHIVRWRYRPTSLFGGAAITLLALIGLSTATVWGRLDRIRSRRGV